MTTEEALQRAEAVLRPMTVAFTRPAADRLDATIAAADLPLAVEALRQARVGYLSAVTGLDLPAPPAKVQTEAQPGSIEVLYHFCEGAAVVTLRLNVAYDSATIPSLCHLIPSATLFERELAEMLGVNVAGTPVTDHLLLPDGWPDGLYPLRKSFTEFTGEKPKPTVKG
jgi:Ni,Fe-hydrogenase III component G